MIRYLPRKTDSMSTCRSQEYLMILMGPFQDRIIYDSMILCSKHNNKDTSSLVIYPNLPGISRSPISMTFQMLPITTTLILRMKRFSKILSKEITIIFSEILENYNKIVPVIKFLSLYTNFLTGKILPAFLIIFPVQYTITSRLTSLVLP